MDHLKKLNFQQNELNSVDHPDQCHGDVKSERRCVDKHRRRVRRDDVTKNAASVLYLPLGGSTSQGCPSTAETSVIGISQVRIIDMEV